MDLSIRGYIKNNFKDSSAYEINKAIEESIGMEEEEALPGMGVFFEILWKNSSLDEQKQITSKLKANLK